MSVPADPVQYVPLPGGTVMLPGNARPDLAYVTNNLVKVTGSGATLWAPTVNTYSVILDIQFGFNTGATVAQRLPALFFQTTPYNTSIEISPTQIQPENTQASYLFSTGLNSAWASRAPGMVTTYQTQLPLLVLQPTGSVILTLYNLQVDDTAPSNVIVTVASIPTGPYLSALDTATSSSTPFVTPVLV